MRKWRCRSLSSAVLLDISRAYLQVHLDESQQQYQRVLYNDKYYRMTRLGFGLSIGPKLLYSILKRILHDLLSSDRIGLFRDDIVVYDGSKEVIEEVTQRLRCHGFVLKDPEPLCQAKLLGLRLCQKDNELWWSRSENVSSLLELVDTAKTIRDASVILGKLGAKYPVLGWLRVHLGVARSRVGVEAHRAGVAIGEKSDWDAPMSEDLRNDLITIKERIVAGGDPTCGRWNIDLSKPWMLYVDASLQAEAAVLMNDGQIVEDAVTMVRHPLHANVHELNALLAGLKLFLQFQQHLKTKTSLRVLCDSACVVGWVSSVLNDRRLPRSKSMFWVLVDRRLQAIRQIIEEISPLVTVTVEHVPGGQNRADAWTRTSVGVGEVVVGAVAATYLSSAVLFPKTKALLGSEPVITPESAVVFARSFHTESGHSSDKHALETARRWFTIPDDCVLVVRKRLEFEREHCSVCRVKQAQSRLKNYPPTGPCSTAAKFNEELFVDFVKTPGHDDVSGFVTLIDGYSRFVTVHEVYGPVSAMYVVNAIRRWCADYGTPSAIRCDRGRENLNRYVSQYCLDHNVKLRPGSIGHPQSQSLVERVHGTLLLLLRTLREEYPQMSLCERMIEARAIYLRRWHSSLGMSPLEKMNTENVPELLEDGTEEEAAPEDDDEPEIVFGPSVGDKVLWRKPTNDKDEFGFIAGSITRELGRGAYGFLPDGRIKEKIVNRDRLVVITDESPGELAPDVPEPRRSARTVRPPNRYGFDVQ
jgi:transposase InsO family protein